MRGETTASVTHTRRVPWSKDPPQQVPPLISTGWEKKTLAYVIFYSAEVLHQCFQHCLSGTRCHRQFSSVILCLFFKSRLKTLLFNQAFTEHWSDLPPATLKLRPYGAIEIRLLLLLLLMSSPDTGHVSPLTPFNFIRYYTKVFYTTATYREGEKFQNIHNRFRSRI